MNILKHSGKGATIALDQRELLMVMALIQEGRDSFACSGHTGRALDQLFCSANVLVEEARRKDLRKNMVQQKVGTVALVKPDSEPKQEGTNG